MAKLKVKIVNALGVAKETKKKTGFVRKFVVEDGTGEQEVVTVFADDLATLGHKAGDVVEVRTGDFLFAA